MSALRKITLTTRPVRGAFHKIVGTEPSHLFLPDCFVTVEWLQENHWTAAPHETDSDLTVWKRDIN